ncbi:DUF1902 domain-containing protein [Pseudoduganella namucuonensis]|uniref:DUF1902 domain-containing protein n=1 Tax=Pseudoduganella namucuonensis TaxID=1035707 RepID=A0A1I7H9R5_9BURK|nr:DUF1902 domain-containing protein [Pseudoduganella namucuonensis]SFU57410.1 protein of unknown function [Pseudoduganella namucuonensis]
MQTIHKIYANWDDDTSVWIAESDDLPGLTAKADTLDQLHAKLATLVPELLLANALVVDELVEAHYELVTEAGPFCTLAQSPISLSASFVAGKFEQVVERVPRCG